MGVGRTRVVRLEVVGRNLMSSASLGPPPPPEAPVGQTRHAGARHDRSRRTLVWLAGGLILGFWLGVGMGSSPPITEQGGGQAFLLVGVEAVAVLVLGLLAVGQRSRDPAMALAGLVIASVVGFDVAPEPIGTWNEQPGTAVVGTPADPDAWWSGSVRCSWRHGDPTVSFVVFEDPQPRAPDGIEPPGLHGSRPTELIWLSQVNLFRVAITGRPVVSWDHGSRPPHWSGQRDWMEVDLLDLASNGQDGTIALGIEEIVISWSCVEGP